MPRRDEIGRQRMRLEPLREEKTWTAAAAAFANNLSCYCMVHYGSQQSRAEQSSARNCSHRLTLKGEPHPTVCNPGENKNGAPWLVLQGSKVACGHWLGKRSLEGQAILHPRSSSLLHWWGEKVAIEEGPDCVAESSLVLSGPRFRFCCSISVLCFSAVWWAWAEWELPRAVQNHSRVNDPDDVLQWRRNWP